ncbi:MAG TPA: helix-turn-helix domain-containing protein [Actinomycetota bacterium]
MKTYGQYCPIARGSEIFAERWTPLIVRNLMLGCHSFSEIHAGLPGISRTLLTQRLRTLGRAGVVETRPTANGRGSLYYLTPQGQDLHDVVHALGTWGARWLELAPPDLDAGVALWSMCRLMERDRLPERPVLIRFEIPDDARKRLWVLVQRPEPEVCRRPPALDEDLVVTASSEWLVKWHMGRISLREARRRGFVTVEGPASVVRALESWGGLSTYADVPSVGAAR